MMSKFSRLPLLLAFAPLINAKTDLTGCTSSDVVAYGGASRIFWDPTNGEICSFLDCGGGAGAPITTQPGCADYSGTATYTPVYLSTYIPPGVTNYTPPGATATATPTAAASSTSPTIITTAGTPVITITSSQTDHRTSETASEIKPTLSTGIVVGSGGTVTSTFVVLATGTASGSGGLGGSSSVGTTTGKAGGNSSSSTTTSSRVPISSSEGRGMAVDLMAQGAVVMVAAGVGYLL